MKPLDFYKGGQRLELGKRIGKGGEGEVYVLHNDPKKAVKIYSGNPGPEREAKVKAMVRFGLAQTASLVAFPDDVVTSKAGKFAGFTMRLVGGFRPVHELYGPKSRKIHYPKADYRFLVRAAANAASAVAQVHSLPCIIGDLNHSGILVSAEATVALIDADSFQFEADQRTYRCLVGVPEFTPPELQGRSLDTVVRTKVHDNFGLAVAIFQLLFMGRHPYAGHQSGGDLTLDQLIAGNLFAYSRARKVSVAPPGVVATLGDLPPEMADGFERAFGLDPLRRPQAAEWLGLLQSLEGHLSRCSQNTMHYYPSAARECPWCRMENASGVMLFLPPFIAGAPPKVKLDNFDVERAWAIIKAIVVPDKRTISPPILALPTTPSEEARKARALTPRNMLIGLAVAAVALMLLFADTDRAVVWIGFLIYAFFRFKKRDFDEAIWLQRYAEADARWDEALAHWHAGLGIDRVASLKANLEQAVNEYKYLATHKAQALYQLKSDRERRQLHEYLDRFLIRRASIPGIGPGKTTTLASFGIESAADISSAVTRVPGFGEATYSKLLAWRAGHAKRFVYNPAPTPSDAQQQAKIEAEYAAKAQTLISRISGGQAEIVQLSHTLSTRRSIPDPALSQAAISRAQLVADLGFLNVAIPPKPAARPAIRPTPITPTRIPPNATAGGVTCPSCGALMVRRTAKRGHGRGRQFWGCSRYPTCRGTRN